ncbi:uncharacterized protein MYCFIDRAFT_215244 [Pseudocercospora fijiensis CIRAD86]|uniref:Zn(2)-C6 fungal-type domain-containing protein n=1 Tax=Pseudocercospora fijiensis (strain CIRAD86) TaxID=383855 RepID=M3B1P0_PSEFD|nr:uncharacterized protein MYCFIDRAFT_215244 [Pseudocercospora fijiensis CIRAD86]EME83268.1 hypothetical protein MYCFIDRAFT_215244 [Pseudocercospora fijiensis CIRAD86]
MPPSQQGSSHPECPVAGRCWQHARRQAKPPRMVCDGLRPACSRCQNLRTECQYEAEEGESRWSALRRRNQVLEQERDQVRELLAFVQARPEPEAQDIFQRIRTSNYDDVFALLRQIKEGVIGLPPHQAMGPLPPPATTGVDRLPPIQTILDVPTRGMTPNHLSHSHSLSSEDSGRASSIPEIPNAQIPLYHAIEPSLRGHQHPTPFSAHLPSLSSEESTGSVGSTSLDPSKPYQTP